MSIMSSKKTRNILENGSASVLGKQEREEPPQVGTLETASQIPGPGLAFPNGPTTTKFSLVRFHLNTVTDPVSHILWVFLPQIMEKVQKFHHH